MRRWTMIWLAVLLSVGFLPRPTLAESGDVEWTRTMGNVGMASAVAAHTTGVYVVGEAGDRYPLSPHIRSYTADGKLRWARTSKRFGASDVAVNDTGVYVAGSRVWGVDGDGCQVHGDALVRKYTHGGRIQWTRFIGGRATRGSGCTGGRSTEWGSGIVVDDTGVYVTGETDGELPGQRSAGDTDLFVRKYTTGGKALWTRQSGTGDVDRGVDIDLDPWGVLVVGVTWGGWPGQVPRGAQDAVVLKYSRSGRLYWTRQFGTAAADEARSISAHGASFYVGGRTEGRFPGQRRRGKEDAWVREYSGHGTPRWTRQFGTHWRDGVNGVEVGVRGVSLTGSIVFTEGGDSDAFVTSFSAAGVRGWMHRFGTIRDDSGESVALGPPPTTGQQGGPRGLYVAGVSDGNGYSGNAFLRKYEE